MMDRSNLRTGGYHCCGTTCRHAAMLEILKRSPVIFESSSLEERLDAFMHRLRSSLKTHRPNRLAVGKPTSLHEEREQYLIDTGPEGDTWRVAFKFAFTLGSLTRRSLAIGPAPVPVYARQTPSDVCSRYHKSTLGLIGLILHKNKSLVQRLGDNFARIDQDGRPRLGSWLFCFTG